MLFWHKGKSRYTRFATIFYNIHLLYLWMKIVAQITTFLTNERGAYVPNGSKNCLNWSWKFSLDLLFVPKVFHRETYKSYGQAIFSALFGASCFVIVKKRFYVRSWRSLSQVRNLPALKINCWTAGSTRPNAVLEPGRSNKRLIR